MYPDTSEIDKLATVILAHILRHAICKVCVSNSVITCIHFSEVYQDTFQPLEFKYDDFILEKIGVFDSLLTFIHFEYVKCIQMYFVYGYIWIFEIQIIFDFLAKICSVTF